MSKHSTYEKIEKVLNRAGRAIAPHEFDSVSIDATWGRQFVGQSESAIGRRLREMRELGRVTSQRREGTAFVEYSITNQEDKLQQYGQVLIPAGA